MAKTKSKVIKDFPAYEEFINKKVIIETIDGKIKIGVLKHIEKFEFVIDTNIYTKEEPVKGYMLFMKHAVKSIRQTPEDTTVKQSKGE